MDGDAKLLKLGDLGISKIYETQSKNDFTQGVGTYSYMAPEVINSNVYTFQVDVW